MKEVTSAQDLVDSVLNAGDKLVVVDFFSPGCGGCKALHPKVRSLTICICVYERFLSILLCLCLCLCLYKVSTVILNGVVLWQICQLAEMHPDVQFLQVNYEEHKSMCYSLNVHVLPFFRFYRGAHGRLCSFSCTNATVSSCLICCHLSLRNVFVFEVTCEGH